MHDAKNDNTKRLLLADKGARVGNFIIDSFCCIFIYILFVLMISFVELSAQTAAIVDDLSFFAICFTYYFAFEYFSGKTAGKYLTRTKVVYRDGTRLTIGRLFIRSICRLVSIDILSFLFGQGLHDRISGSFVVMDNSYNR